MNELSRTQEAKKVLSKLGFIYVAGTAVVYGLNILLGVVLAAAGATNMLMNMNYAMILSSIIVYGCALPIIIVLTRGMETTTLPKTGMKWYMIAAEFLICYAFTFLSNILGNIVTQIIGEFKGSEVSQDLVDMVSEGNMLLNFVLMVLLAPIMEEYVFRKVLVDRTVRFGKGIAIITSGLMFGLFHGNLNQFAYAVVLGMFFAFLYIKTGDVRITMLLHAIVNFMGSMVSGALFRLVDLDALQEIDMADQDAYIGYVLDHLPGFLLLVAYLIALVVIVLAGIILAIVLRRQFRMEPVENPVPKGERFAAMVLNPGMIVFYIVWVGLIILNLFL